MRIVFIADAHLKKKGDNNYRTLLVFLSSLQGKLDKLFIVGDLFEFWLGYRDIPFLEYLPVLQKLKELVASGTKIVYFEGNHDFHMGPFFEEELQVELYRGPTTIHIDGKKVYLCHGDQINNNDYGYHVLRFILHSRFIKGLIPFVPPALTVQIADQMGRGSKKKHNARNNSWDYVRIIREFAEDRFADGVDVVITGHFHKPFLEKFGQTGGKTLLSLGDWITQFTYGDWIDGEISLKRWQG